MRVSQKGTDLTRAQRDGLNYLRYIMGDRIGQEDITASFQRDA